jgi:hypothetical protein
MILGCIPYVRSRDSPCTFVQVKNGQATNLKCQ